MFHGANTLAHPRQMTRRKWIAGGFTFLGRNSTPSFCILHFPFCAYTPALMKIIGIIPARYASTRFPGKPLARIAGKTLIQHVVERCQAARSLAEVIVATDDTRIWEVAQNFCRAEMTAPNHARGTDRIAEVARNC